MPNAAKKEKPEGGYATAAGVVALSLAVLMHVFFGGLSPEQADQLPPFLGAVYKAVGIAGVSVPLGVLGLVLIAREAFFAPRRQPVREQPRKVVVVRRPGEAATLVEADRYAALQAVTAQPEAEAAGQGAADSLPEAEPLDEAPHAEEGAEPGAPADPGPQKIRGGWGGGRPGARIGTVTDASEPEKTTAVRAGGGQMQLSSAKYLKKKGGRRDAELHD